MVEINKPYTRSSFISVAKNLKVEYNFDSEQLNNFNLIKKKIKENYDKFLTSRKSNTKKFTGKRGNYKGKHHDRRRRRDYDRKSTVRVENWRSYKDNKPKRDEKSIEVIRKKINMELNKISGDNFEKIKLIVFEILDGSKDLLDILVADLFEKAIKQQTFCEHYARLALDLNSSDTFKDKLTPILINYCKDLYKKNEKLFYDDEGDYDDFCEYLSRKKKFIGNFQFMGELYKLSLISVTIIENFFNLLLKDIKSDSEMRESYSECMCKLLSVIGNKLEEQYSTKLVFYNKYLKQIKEFSTNKEMFKPRIRFLFMDCLERKKWL